MKLVKGLDKAPKELTPEAKELLTVNVLGLGESLKEYVPSQQIKIGVNDIEKHHKVDCLVCVDRMKAFKKNRLKTIKGFEGVRFFTHLTEWKDQKGYREIKLSKSRGLIEDIESKDVVPYSNNSAYVAIALAYRMGAVVINVFGVDFVNHSNIKGPSLDAAIKDLNALTEYIRNKGVAVNFSKGSIFN